MTDIRKIVKVFLASPGDLGSERVAAKAVVDEFNKLWAHRTGYHVELVGWEDTVSGYGRPQQLINRDLEQCELFIGMIWKRWGTPPSTTGLYTSGFEEEFETSLQSRRTSERPEITLLFKEIEAGYLRDPGEELQKVIKFKEKIIAGKEVLFQTFFELPEFEARIRASVTSYVHKLQDAEADTLSKAAQTRPPEEAQSQDAGTESDARETPLSTEGATFLREFLAITDRTRSSEQIGPVEVARFRLLAKIIGQQGNDERSLGIHDANLIFAHRAELSLGRGELLGLVDTGLERMDSENVPLWHWLVAVDGIAQHILAITAWVGSAIQQAGAISAMRLIGEPIPTLSERLNRQEFISRWLALDAPSALKVAALGYLGEFGLPADLDAVRSEAQRSDYQTTSAAVEAIVRISLREGREQAIRALYEFQPQSISAQLVRSIFDRGASVSTELIRGGTGHRSPDVRAITVTLLRERSALPPELAEKLLADDDARVRFESLKALMAAGKTYSNEKIKSVLVKPKPGLGLFSVLSDEPGERCWDEYRSAQLAGMKDQELEVEAAIAPAVNQDARIVLDDRHFSARGPALRRAIDNRFSAEFADALNTLARVLGAENDTVKRMRGLEDHMRKRFTRQGLDVLCRKGAVEDLARIRREIQDEFVAYSDEDLHYLGRHGEWSDIPLLIKWMQRPEPGSTLLYPFGDERYAVAAQAVYAIGHQRPSELLLLEMPGQLLANLIVVMADRVFRSVPDSTLSALFHSEIDQVRKAAALKCIRALPKRRLSQLLDGYFSAAEQRYYNIVHWLDFGVSMPRDRAARAASIVLARTWPQ